MLKRLNKSKLVAIFIVLSLLVGMLAGCSGSSDPTTSDGASGQTEATSSAAGTKTGSGSLSIYTALPEDFSQLLFDEFEADTGIKVNSVRLSAGEIYARVQAESANPQASVWYGGSAETFRVAAEDGLLEAYESPELANINDEYKDPDNLWSPVYLSVLGILVNNDWMEENKVDKPTEWEDMLDEAYKGQIAIAHPATSGMSYMWLSAVVTRFGEEEAFDYLTKLNDNIFQYTKSSNSPTQMVGLGEAAATFCYNPQYSTLIDSGYNVDIIYPEDGTGFEIAATALIKGGPEEEQENARIFIDWLLSTTGQELTAEKFYGIPINNKAAIPDGLISMDGLNLMDIDLEWSSSNRERLINLFETKIRGQENLS